MDAYIKHLTSLSAQAYNINMNKLDPKRQAQMIAALVEGNSIRATVRITGIAKNTIVKLLVDVGKACAEYQYKTLRNLPCQKVQCDEIWSFWLLKGKERAGR